jgi:hypothetical protein
VLVSCALACDGRFGGFRRVLSATVSCRPGRATAEREQPEDRGFRRWRLCVDDLGRCAFTVPVADLGDRGPRAERRLRRPVLAQRLPEVLQSPGETLDRRVPPKAAKRSQVTDRDTPTTSPITAAAAVFLPPEHRAAFPTCAVQRAFSYSNRSCSREMMDSQVDSQHPAPVSTAKLRSPLVAR